MTHRSPTCGIAWPLDIESWFGEERRARGCVAVEQPTPTHAPGSWRRKAMDGGRGTQEGAAGTFDLVT